MMIRAIVLVVFSFSFSSHACSFVIGNVIESSLDDDRVFFVIEVFDFKRDQLAIDIDHVVFLGGSGRRYYSDVSQWHHYLASENSIGRVYLDRRYPGIPFDYHTIEIRVVFDWERSTITRDFQIKNRSYNRDSEQKRADYCPSGNPYMACQN